MTDTLARVLRWITEHPGTNVDAAAEEIRRPKLEVQSCFDVLKRQHRIVQVEAGRWWTFAAARQYPPDLCPMLRTGRATAEGEGMNAVLKVEKGVGLPDTYCRYPFKRMDVGDSFFAEKLPKQVAAAASSYTKRHPAHRFITRKVREGDRCGTRCWRVPA